MPTIAIVGAGPGLGLSIAKVFGGHGYDVALIARDKGKLDALVAELAETGITAEGFAADVAEAGPAHRRAAERDGPLREDRRAGVLPARGPDHDRARGRHA